MLRITFKRWEMPVTRRFDQSALEQAPSLHELLTGDLGSETLEAWRGSIEGRGALLDNLILGTISWNKDLGRPDGPAMTSGFSIHHEAWYEFLVVTADGLHEDHGWRTASAPSSWDAITADKDQVGFMTDFAGPFPNRLSVEFGPAHHWRDSSPFAGVRRITPAQVTVQLSDQHRFAFVAFEVVVTPYLELERSVVLADH
jgi:hypothetical protein